MDAAVESAQETAGEILYFDVLIVGAGISGIDAAYHLQKFCPEKSFTVLETQETFGGTWTFVLEADGEGTSLSITEDGWIDPPVYRALTRWAFGYDATARAYIDQLAAHVE